MTDAGESVTHVGTIRAPVQTVFAAWTDAAQLQRWLAPIAEADGRVGGHFRLESERPTARTSSPASIASSYPAVASS